MKIMTANFWEGAGERAIKTFAQAAVAALGSGAVGLFSIDYAGVFSLAGGAALLSILTSITISTK